MPLIRTASPAETDIPMREVKAQTIGEMFALAAHGDALARETAFAALARRGGEAAVAALVRLIDAEDVGLRNAAMETLASLGALAIDGLTPLFEDADPNQRVYALTTLARIEHPRAAEVAIGVALSDPNVNVVAAAVETVAASGGAGMAEDLRKVPARFPKHPFLDFAVRAALRKIG